MNKDDIYISATDEITLRQLKELMVSGNEIELQFHKTYRLIRRNGNSLLGTYRLNNIDSKYDETLTAYEARNILWDNATHIVVKQEIVDDTPNNLLKEIAYLERKLKV